MNRVFALFFLGFAGGIAFRSFFDFGVSFPVFLFALGALFLFIRYSYVLKNMRISYIGVAGIVLLSSAFGILRYDMSAVRHQSEPLENAVGSTVVLRGVVVDEPDVRETHTNLVVRAEELGSGEEVVSASGKILVITEHYPAFQYGDIVTVRGKLGKPQNFSSGDTGREFDYVSYLRKDGIGYRMFYPELVRTGEGGGNPAQAALFSIKQSLMRSVSRVLPEPHASLVGGMVFGAKRGLGEDVLDAFRTVGIIHIVVLSGYNITILAEAVGRVASFLPRTMALFLSSATIVGFVLMVGAGATVVRAAIMALLVLLARATGRVYAITQALFAAAFLMLLHNPQILVFDPSFQLSFAAPVGLLYVAPLIEKHLNFLPTTWQVREYATATIATQLFVLPLLLYTSGMLSVVALPVNLLILVLVPATMFFGFLTGVLGLIHAALAAPFAFIAYGLLQYELSVVSFFDSLPFASIAIPHFSAWLLFAAYAAYAILLFLVYKKAPE